MLDKNPGGIRSNGDGLLHGDAPAYYLDHLHHRPRIGTAGTHRFQIQFEVAYRPAFADVAFFTKNDLIDEPASLCILCWHPWEIDAGKSALQSLQQGHKIPHGKHVRFHEDVERLKRSDRAIEWMLRESLAQWGDPVFEVLRDKKKFVP